MLPQNLSRFELMVTARKLYWGLGLEVILGAGEVSCKLTGFIFDHASLYKIRARRGGWL